jgi:hypothetical protein
MVHRECLNGDSHVTKFLRVPSWPVRKVFAAAFADLLDLSVA